jgi:dihydroflavonol-4-reductase
MIAVEHVAEAIIGALENGKHGQRYTVGDENHTYNEMLEMMMSAKGENKRIINIPRFLAVQAGSFIEKDFKKKGLEGGLEAKLLMKDIMTDYLYFDPEETAKELGYNRGGIKEAIIKTMKACYPEKFSQ